MRAGRGVIAVAIGAALTLAACSNDGRLMNLQSTGAGPDEFAIIPPKPLELPTNLAELPPPTPGGVNRTDQHPEADAVAALGGNPEAVLRSGGSVPAADAALVNYASRNGVTPGIRQTLAAEDEAFRMDNQGRLLERLANVNVYYRAYRDYSLDQYSELARWRAAGLRTPTAPPEQPQ